MSTKNEGSLRDEVTDVLLRYASGIDGRDWELFRTCFTEDCDADYGSIGHWRSADEITTWMRDVHAPCGHTMHRVTNVVASETATGATARAYVDALVMFGDNQQGTRALGYYDDELVPADDGWKIARRRFTTVLVQLVPEGTVLDIDAPRRG